MRISFISIFVVVAILVLVIIDYFVGNFKIHSNYLLVIFLIFIVFLIWQLIHLEKLLRFLHNQNINTSQINIPKALVSNGDWDEVFYRMEKLVRKFQKENQNIQKNSDDFISAIQAMPIGLIMLDKKNKILWLNKFAEIYLNLNSQKDCGNNLINLIRHPNFIKFINENITSKTNDDEQDLQGLVLKAEDINHKFSLLIQQINYENGKIIIAQDISDSMRIEKMRRHFVDNVSHELKTPLSVIKACFENINELPLSDTEKKQNIRIVDEQMHKMESLIRDLLILAKLEGETQSLITNEVSIKNIFDNLKSIAENLSQGRHHFIYQIQEGINMNGNDDELLSAFVNIVNNAIYYSPRGGKINIDWFVDNTTKEKVFAVSDEGVGIASKHIYRITERFYRIDESRKLNPKGTGLGLAIVRHVLLRHNAKLNITSQENQGSRFEVRFAS